MSQQTRKYQSDGIVGLDHQELPCLRLMKSEHGYAVGVVINPDQSARTLAFQVRAAKSSKDPRAAKVQAALAVLFDALADTEGSI